MFSNKRKVFNNEPTEQSIYITLFVEYFNKIANLETEYTDAKKNNDTSLLYNIKFMIKKNLDFFKILLDKTKPEYINITIPIDSQGNMVYENSTNIVNYKPQYQIILDKLKTIWLKDYIMKLWINAGGIISQDTSVEYFDKYEIVKFLNEIEKKFININKDMIKLYKDKYYNILDKENKLKLHTYLIYLLLKNKIINMTTNDLEKIVKYYNMGLDYNLLDDETTKKIFESLDKYFLDKRIEDITDNDLIEYEKIINENKYISSNNKQLKIKEYQKNYYVNKLNNLLFSPDYKNHVNEIFDYSNKLKILDYEFNSKQKRKLNVFILNLEKTEIKFNSELLFPLFTPNELEKLKEQILIDVNNICKIVKDLFPYYAISEDYFCLKINYQTKELTYLNQKEIYRTINAYCVIMIIIGLVNYKLNITKQNYQIIIKGGKALQLILSKILLNNKSDIKYKSDDIDLIISPNEGIEYNELECKNLANNISLLIQWILNKNVNPYDIDNYISTILGKDYNTLIKLSHKIQKSNDTYHLRSYTPLVDFDFGKKKDALYSDLIYDKKKCKYGELLYIYQNLDSFILEKVYYLDDYINEINKLKLQIENNKETQYTPEQAKKDSNNYANYERLIDKFSSQIKNGLKILLLANKIEITKYINDLVNKHNIDIKMNNIISYIL